MKPVSLTLLIGLASSACLYGAEPAPKKAPPPFNKAEFIKRFDKNGDGKLNQAEQEAARKTHKAELLKLYDKNGNGRIDPEEREEPRKEFQKGREKPKNEPPPAPDQKAPSKNPPSRPE